MNPERRDFDKEAAAWDENPARVKLANDVAGAVMRQVTLNAGMDVLDFGCGTGILALRLAPLVRSVTGVDNSQGMLDGLGVKIAREGLTNIRALHFDVEAGDTLPDRYDLIVSNMTLHHIRDTGLLLNRLYHVLSPSGHLCIADLNSDDGQFHSDNQGVFHSGFDRTALRQAFMDAGFRDVQDMTAAEVVKPARDGELRRFSIFLMTGLKGGTG